MTLQGPHGDFSPIFVVGFPRSGTTLLATMLSRHSRIAAPPETRFMEEVVDRARDHTAMLARVAASRRCRDLALDGDLLAAAFRSRPPSYDWLFRVLLESYAANAGKDLVAEKSPIHLLHVPTLAGWYPKARFLLMVRDGRDCVLSLLKAPWAHDSVLRHSVEWRRRMSWARRLVGADAPQLQVVRYEDLLPDPETQLRRAMDFLGLAFERRQLHASRDSTAVPGWEKAWKGKAAERLDPSRVAAWRRDADAIRLMAIESVLSDELAAWGYEPVSRRRDLTAALAGAIFSSEVFKRFERLVRQARAVKR